MTDQPLADAEIVVSFDPQLEIDPDSGRVAAVEIDERRLVIDPETGPADEVGDVLRRIREEERPVAFGVVDDAITWIRLPILSPVRALDRRGRDTVVVHLFASHAELRLTPDGDREEEWVDLLEDAARTGRTLAVTADDHALVVDVREVPDEFALPTAPTQVDERGGWFAALFRWMRTTCAFPFGLWRSVGPSGASALFASLATRVCVPASASAPCIPFNYPDDGCWGRAHEMCRLITESGARPRKTWITGSLRVDTANNPTCEVRWGWHVAPTVCVRGSGLLGFLRIRKMVFDPAVFDAPVARATWKARQNDAGATLEDLPWAIFHKWGSSTPGGKYSRLDPTFSGTNAVLAQYRTALALRAASDGPPPYPC